MRVHDTTPAWAVRQRIRRLVRHSDQKVVRWIGQPHAKERDTLSTAAESSSNDNTLAYAVERSSQVS